MTLKESSVFFRKVANPAGGWKAPVDVNDPEVKFGRLDGFKTQAGMMTSITSLTK